MKMKVILLFSTLVIVSLAEKSGPYPPSGWKPQGARLELPTEYGAPFKQPANLQQQVDVNQVTFTTESTTTEIDFETTTVDRGYLPPETTSYPDEEAGDPRSIQNLPGQDPPVTFTRFGGVQSPEVVQQAPVQKPQNARFSELEDFKSQFFASQYQLQFQPRNGQLRVGLVNNVNNRQNRLGNLEEKPQVQQEYGVPDNTDTRDLVEEIPENEQEEPEQQDEPEQRQESEEDQENESNDESQESSGETPDDEPTIAVANAVQSGQYYILAPDNTLQKVQFRTLQTEEDRFNNGFTAQLRYQPVEPIKPPVYGYNEQGLLVRIYRK